MCFCGDYRWVRHVVQSSHPQAQYQYDPESDRHSVVVPLDAPQAGSDVVTVDYHFTCKTSCSRGMNRKPIDVIFTLETELWVLKDVSINTVTLLTLLLSKYKFCDVKVRFQSQRQ